MVRMDNTWPTTRQVFFFFSLGRLFDLGLHVLDYDI